MLLFLLWMVLLGYGLFLAFLVFRIFPWVTVIVCCAAAGFVLSLVY